jgi:archaellum biogenesis ATPase FlaH
LTAKDIIPALRFTSRALSISDRQKLISLFIHNEGGFRENIYKLQELSDKTIEGVDSFELIGDYINFIHSLRYINFESHLKTSTR